MERTQNFDSKKSIEQVRPGTCSIRQIVYDSESSISKRNMAFPLFCLVPKLMTNFVLYYLTFRIECYGTVDMFPTLKHNKKRLSHATFLCFVGQKE